MGEATPLRSSTGGIQSYYVATPEREGVYTLSAYPLETLLGEHQGFRLNAVSPVSAPSGRKGSGSSGRGRPPLSSAGPGTAWRLHQPVPGPCPTRSRSKTSSLTWS